MSEAVNDQAATETETELEPLSDESLEEVAGGICSFMMCSGGMNDAP